VAQLAGDFNTGANYVASGLPKFRGLDEADFVMKPDRSVPVQSLPDLSNENIRIEVENCVSALSRTGLEVFVVNTTHPKLQIPAFYTMIPGAHFRERATGTSVGMFSAKLIAEEGNPEWALRALERMDQILPGKYYVQFYLGFCHLNVNNPERALFHLEKALDLQPKGEDMVSVLSYMGVCLKDQEKYREAIDVLKKAETFDDDRTDIYNLMGFCYYKLKEHEEAIHCFQKVLDLNPGSAIDYANLASNYRELGDKENAIAYYRLALELDPNIDFARDHLEKLLR
jgi:ribosomal protein S12 methylthiotransferase accessory factor